MSLVLAQVTGPDRTAVPQRTSPVPAALPAPRRATPSPTRTTRDALDVSLDDDDLRAETELTVLLMIAANDSDETLSQQDIDRVLGTTP
jgi:hypothetical protein